MRQNDGRIRSKFRINSLADFKQAILAMGRAHDFYDGKTSTISSEKTIGRKLPAGAPSVKFDLWRCQLRGHGTPEARFRYSSISVYAGKYG
jgi:hypothetical protein